MNYKLTLIDETCGPYTFTFEALEDLDREIDQKDQSSIDHNLSDDQNYPLFGVIWPAARSLAQFISQINLKNRRILEIGCGLGLPSFVASKMGAEVTAMDIHPDVETMMGRNMTRNNIDSIRYQRASFLDEHTNLGIFDLVIASDIIYSGRELPKVCRFIKRHMSPKGCFILGDPQRYSLPTFLQALDTNGLAQIPLKTSDNIIVFSHKS